jgi:hypothetical protein
MRRWSASPAAATAAAIVLVTLLPLPSGASDDGPAFRSPDFPWQSARAADAHAFVPAFESAQSALNRLERAYRDLDLETYASLLTTDYRFITNDPRFDGDYPDGLDRASDIASTAGLLGVVPVEGKPRITSIDFDLGLVSEGADSEHADSLDHYRLLVVPNPAMTVHADGAEDMQTTRSLLAFYMVRGDAAVLPAGAPADAKHWYLRRWVETPGKDGEADAVVAPSVADLRMARNPASGPFEVVLTLPSSGLYQIEIFDVAGRRIRREPPATFQAGTTHIELRETGKLAAGIYWLRLTQNGRALATRVATRL